MTQEEKAKRYDEALEAARKELGVDRKEWKVVQRVLRNIFPELRESEDERVIKALETFINQPEIADKITFEARIEWLSWLDKQKEEEGYEAIPVESTLEYKLGFKAGKEFEKQKECVADSSSKTSADVDERIRKDIIDLIEFGLTEGSAVSPGSHTTKEEALAWLEKQKEQKPITESKRLANEVIEYLTRCGYSPVLKDDSKKEHFHIDIPRHEDDFWLSEEYKHCHSVLGEYYMEGDYGGDTYTLYIWRTKEEQKPVQTDDEKEYIRTLKNLISGFIRDKQPEDVVYYQRVYDWLDGRHIEQKPAEWDELQSEFKNINEAFEDGKKEVVAHPKKYGLCKPAEWSKNDTVFLNEITDFFENRTVRLQHDIDMYAHWLKSLPMSRPKSSDNWKPSEEQMKALCSQLPIVRGKGDKVQDILQTLYDDLKELM